MPFGLQPTHLIIIVVVALLIFGPAKLPEVGRAFGKTIREFQAGIKETSQVLQEEVRKTTEPEEPAVAQVPCKQCSKPMQSDMKFCPECGAAQAA